MTTELEKTLAAIKREASAKEKRVRDAIKKEQTTVDLRVAGILREVAPDLYASYSEQARANMRAETEARSARARTSKTVRIKSDAPGATASTQHVTTASRTDSDSVDASAAQEHSDGWDIPTPALPCRQESDVSEPGPTARGDEAHGPKTPSTTTDLDPFELARAATGIDGAAFDPGFSL
ncbi:hypothetical protein [Frondihabitans australicus]|uniref:hypothetical protein n=1 Tax=Frondihabitans australicus TaxID=386892 RepID=UPI0011C49CFA|nr:hypothetical protein [Frondihabitans australicus]